MLTICDQTWPRWRKPDNLVDTKDLTWSVATMPHTLARCRTQTAEVTSECFDYYANRALRRLFEYLTCFIHILGYLFGLTGSYSYSFIVAGK